MSRVWARHAGRCGGQLGPMETYEYADYDALGLAELVRDKQVTAAELVDVAERRIDEVNPVLNAVVERRDALVAQEARHPGDGIFGGVPFLVKDMDGVLGGEPNTASSRSLTGWRPVRDSDLFARFKAAGLLIVGKTNCPEFGIFGVTEPELRGPARNPWNPDHTPGGSSGGSAAAVAARIVPMAHGGDGGGSIRIPASACGLFGLKPTRGRQPLGPYASEFWDGYVVPGVISLSVRDTAAALDATHGASLGAPYAEPPAPDSFLAAAQEPAGRLRIGYSTKSLLGSQPHPDAVAAVTDAVVLLEELGHELIELDLPIDRDVLTRTYLVVVAAGIAAEIAETEHQTGRKPRPGDFELPTWFLGQVGRELSALEHTQAREAGQRLGYDFAVFYEQHRLDAHLTATMAYPPVEVGELAPTMVERGALAALRRASTGRALRLVLDQLAANSLEKTPNTQVFNMTGQPAMSVPLWWNDQGLPVGVQLAGRFGDEVTLLQLASQLEQARPWFDRRPPIVAQG